jgi:hypothetical protein
VTPWYGIAKYRCSEVSNIYLHQFVTPGARQTVMETNMHLELNPIQLAFLVERSLERRASATLPLYTGGGSPARWNVTPSS